MTTATRHNADAASKEAPFLFCFGLGYSAGHFARRMQAKGWRVGGTCREADAKTAWDAEGIEAHVFDDDHPLPADALIGVTHVLVSIPADAEGDTAFRQCGKTLCQSPTLHWFGYLSTTGVYGTRDGGTVDESADLRPSSQRSKNRVEAERRWLSLQADRGLPVHIFRLAGIYGPGRSVIDQIKTGAAKRILKPGQLFSRIHIEDIANVLEASIAHPDPGARYNVCDDAPEEPSKVIEYACGLLGIAPPPAVGFDDADLSPMARTFWADNKRVDNTRIKQDLGVVLTYPDYKTGLRAILKP